MHQIVNKVLLARDKFMPEIHLEQPAFTYSYCGPFTKKNSKVYRDGRYKIIYKNKLDKACFQHDMAYGDVKDLAKRTASNKFLRDKTFNIAKHLNYDGCQRALAFMVYNFCDKKSW